MARAKAGDKKRVIESYDHRDKQRVNNLPVGLVTHDTDTDTDPDAGRAFDRSL